METPLKGEFLFGVKFTMVLNTLFHEPDNFSEFYAQVFRNFVYGNGLVLLLVFVLSYLL